jgi:hypothetical protein
MKQRIFPFVAAAVVAWSGAVLAEDVGKPMGSSNQDAPVPSVKKPGSPVITPKVDPDPEIEKTPPNPNPDPMHKDIIKPPPNIEGE